MNFNISEEDKNRTGIYCIKNEIDGKAYIGQTQASFYNRYTSHRALLKRNKHYNKELQDAYNSVGADNISFSILEIISEKDEIDAAEQKWISFYREKGLSYNVFEGGNTGRHGLPLSEKAKRQIGEANREHMLGRKASEATRQKMSKTRTGHVVKTKAQQLDETSAYQAKVLLMDGLKPAEVAKRMGVSYKTINGIYSNDAWNSIKVPGWDDFKNSRKTYTRLSKEDHQRIRDLYKTGQYIRWDLAEMYGKTKKMIDVVLRT